jgi:thioredoxin:protein disulfide reductase
MNSMKFISSIATPLVRGARRRGAWLMAVPLLALTLVAQATDFLRAEEAYQYAVESNDAGLLVSFNIRDGYYLYKKRFAFSTDTPGVRLGDAHLPKGLPHSDEYFGEQEIYRGAMAVEIPYARIDPTADHIDLRLKLQGCADAGLCYPPQNWTARVTLPPAAPPPRPATSVATTRPTDLLGKLGAPASASAPDGGFLPVDEAFQPSAQSGAQTVTVRIAIAQGYYLYQSRLRVASADADAHLGAPVWPTGEIHHDDYFGDQVVYRDVLTFPVPYQGSAPIRVKLTYQGCADAGLCYPPQTRMLEVRPTTEVAPASEQDRLAQLIRRGHLLTIIAAFMGFGLLLSFTPCVLPMVPILAGILAGDGERSGPWRSFALSLAYVGGMVIAYMLAGIIFAAAGKSVQTLFQQPWILVVFALLFIGLALAMFGFYELALPAGLQTRLAATSQRLGGGRFVSTAVMGALSSLIVSACVAPPLVAAFAVIGQTGDLLRGALALGALAFGMGIPLLLVGASAGRLLPKAGPWMETVKALFGVLFLGVAAWMLDRLLPARLMMGVWALVAASLVWVLWRVGAGRGGRLARRTLAAAAAAYALLLATSGWLGGTDPLHPLTGTRWGHPAVTRLPFRRIKTVAELDTALAQASRAGQRSMLDFAADWCVSCKEMEARTFSDPAVRAALNGYLLLQADVTANDDADQALLARFHIVGPPTTAFFAPDGTERPAFRLVGFVTAADFMTHLTHFEHTP